ncbi:MAG: hypothetical protein SGBAC_006429 [Bacillariaceae sp.]
MSQQPRTPNRQGSIAARYLNTRAFKHGNSMRYAGSPPQKLTPNKSLNESTFTASTVMLDSSMGSSSNEDSSTGRSQVTSPTSSRNSSVNILNRSMDFTPAPVTPGRDSTVSSSAGSQSYLSRRSLINRFRKRRQQKNPIKLGEQDGCSSIEPTESPNKASPQQPQHQQFAPTYLSQESPTLNRPELGNGDFSVRENRSSGSSTASSSFTKNSHARKILSSRIALRARSKGLFPITTPQPRHPQPQPVLSRPQQHREETETAPTEIMAPTEVMQNLSSVRGMGAPRQLSEAGAPTEITTNQSKKATKNDFRAHLSLPSPHHALLDDATITSDQNSLPIKSLFDLQQSSSISTTNSLEQRVALHPAEANAIQSPPRAWKNGPKRSLDSLFSKQHRLQNNKSDDASSCFTEERELDNDAVVQRVFSLDKVDLEQANPLPLPSLLSTNVNSKQACAQVKPRHPTQVSLATKEQQETRLGEIPEATLSQEKDVPMEEGLSFASKEVHAPSLQSEEGASSASKQEEPVLSFSASVSLDGLAFAKSNEDGVFEDSAESLYGNVEHPPSIVSPEGSVQGNDDDFCLYDDLDNMSMEANPPSIGSIDNDNIPTLQPEPVSTPHTRLTSIITPENVSNDDRSKLDEKLETNEGEWMGMINRYRHRSSDSSSKSAGATTASPERSTDKPLRTSDVVSSPWEKADVVNTFAERRSFGSIKDRVKAFDNPQKVWKPPVKGKVWKPPSKVASPQAPRQNDTPTSPDRGVDVGLESDYHYEEKKTDEAPVSYIRDDDADTLSVKSIKDVWESRISGNLASSPHAKDDFDIDNDTIRDDDDDCASVKSLRDAWEIKFSNEDLDIGFNDDLGEDAGTVKGRREQLQQRILDQQAIPRTVSVDVDQNDDLDLDDGNESVKSLRKLFDTPTAPKRESVNKLRSMFEPSGAAAKSSPARSKSWRANKSPGRSTPTRNRSFNSQGSTPRSSGNVSHGDEEDPLRRMAMAWSKKRTVAKRDCVPSTQTESHAQEISTSKPDAARMEIIEVTDDGFVSGTRGKQSETTESANTMNAGENAKFLTPASNRSYRERSMMAASKSTAPETKRQGPDGGKSAPSMQDRLDRWSSRLKATKKKPLCVQDSFSMELSVSETSMQAASSLGHIGRESASQPGEEEQPMGQLSMLKGDTRGRSMDTEYSDTVTLDVSIAEVSNITDPSGLRTMRSQDTLSDVVSSPGRAQLVSPSRMTVELSQVVEESTPEESNLMPQLPNPDHISEPSSSVRMQRDIRSSTEYNNSNPFSPVSGNANEPVEFEQDPYFSFEDQFAIEEKQSMCRASSIQDRRNPAKMEEASVNHDVGSVASSATFSSARVSNPTTKRNSRLRMVPVLRRPTASSNSASSEQPIPEDLVHHMQSPRKQPKKVSWKLSDEKSVSSENSRVTEKTASSSELSSLPPIPSQYDDNYEAVMQERHQMLMQRQHALKERVAGRQGPNPSISNGTEPVQPMNNSNRSEPVTNQRAQGYRQSRIQTRVFGRTHPMYGSTQRLNVATPKANKAASRSLFSKKAQQQRVVEAPITPTSISSPARSHSSRPSPSNPISRSLFSKKQAQAPSQGPVTPPRSEPVEENQGYGYSPMRTGSPIKATIPRYHPRSQAGRKQQQATASKKQPKSLYNTMASTLGFGQPESAHDIVARLQSYQSSHQPTKQRVVQQPAPVVTDDFADFANFRSSLSGDEWL